MKQKLGDVKSFPPSPKNPTLPKSGAEGKKNFIDLPLKFRHHSEMSAKGCSAQCPSGLAGSLMEPGDRNLLTLKE